MSGLKTRWTPPDPFDWITNFFRQRRLLRSAQLIMGVRGIRVLRLAGANLDGAAAAGRPPRVNASRSVRSRKAPTVRPGRAGWFDRHMAALGATHLAALLCVVLVISVASGFLGAALARRNRPRGHRYFVLGFLSGVVTGVRLSRRSGVGARLRTLAAVRRRPVPLMRR